MQNKTQNQESTKFLNKINESQFKLDLNLESKKLKRDISLMDKMKNNDKMDLKPKGKYLVTS